MVEQKKTNRINVSAGFLTEPEIPEKILFGQ
jgi:hypothetical protein